MSALRPDVPVGSTDPYASVPLDVEVPEVITLEQPVPVQRGDELVWLNGTEEVTAPAGGEEPTPQPPPPEPTQQPEG